MKRCAGWIILSRLVDTFVNKIYLYDDRMAVLCVIQDSHSDVTIDDMSSSKVALSGVDKKMHRRTLAHLASPVLPTGVCKIEAQRSGFNFEKRSGKMSTL